MTAVMVNGGELPQVTSREAFERAESGWVDAGGGVVLAKSGVLPVGQAKVFEFRTRSARAVRK